MSNGKNIVILGAGYGGVKAAKLLNRKLKDSNISITLIDKHPYHTLMTELHEVAGARTDKEAVQISLKKIFSATRVNVVIDQIESIDFQKQELKSGNSKYSYDYLVLGTGAEPAFFGIPGVKEAGFTLWSLEDAIKLREHIEQMFKLAAREKDAAKRKEMLSFVVAGAGFTGIETAGELVEWKRRLSREYDIPEAEVRLMVVEAMGSILPILDEGLIKRSERYLQRKKVDVITNAPITEVKEESITLKDGRQIPTRTLIWTCGIQGSSFAAGLGLTMGKRGRIQINEYMQSMDYGNVYVVGDNAYFEEDSKPIPQIVEAALQTAGTAVYNIIADMEQKPKKAFKSNYHGIMVSIGSRYAVANLMNRSMSGFVAMAIKHVVNIHYQFEVAGVMQVIAYCMHEFVDIRDNRSFIGGHLANRTPILWLAILRVYLGVIWLIEGINKVKEGWLVPGSNFIVALPKASDVPLTDADAVSNATQVTQSYPTPLISKPPAIYQWFTDNIISPHAYLFQVSVVLMEIAIGLALIAGLFTILAALGSLFLCGNFIISAMAGSEIFWHIFAGIAMFGGAGRAFGLDYYVMPWLKDWWKRTRLARRTYLYVD